MATIPVYDSKNTLQPQLSEPLRQGEATKAYEPLREVTAALQKTGEAWQEAHDTMQMTKAKAEYEIGMAAINAEAANDKDLNGNMENYKLRMQELKDKTLGMIDNQKNAKQFGYDVDVNNAIAESKYTITGRQQEIEYNKKNFVSALDGVQKKINNATTVAERQAYVDERNNLIMSNVVAGTIDQNEANDYLDASIENSILYEIASDPSTKTEDSDVYKKIKERGDVSEDKRLELLSKAKTKIEENEQRLKKEVENNRIVTLEQQFQAQQEFENNASNMSLEQSIAMIDDGTNRGIYDEKWAKARKKAILSTAGIDEQKQNEWEARMIMNIDGIGETVDFAKTSDKKGRKNVEQYLKGIRELEIQILEGKAQGFTDEKKSSELLQKLYNSKTAKATEYLASNDRKWEYDARDAYKNIFSKQLTTGDAYRAVRMFFNEASTDENGNITEYKEMNTKEGARLATEIVDKINHENRIAVLDANDAEIENKMQEFDTTEAADASGLPAGTITLVGGRRYRI